MRVAKFTACAALLLLASAETADGNPAIPPALSGCLSNDYEIVLTAELDDETACPRPGSVRATPSCVDAYYTTSPPSWPEITWFDGSPEKEKIKWEITAQAGYAHDHLPSPIVLDYGDDFGHVTQSFRGRAHRAQGCDWFYELTAYGPSAGLAADCTATLDPGIKFNPGGGGGAPFPSKYLWLLLGAGVLLAWSLFRRRRAESPPTETR